MRRFLAVLVPLTLLAACSDDDEAAAPSTTTTTALPVTSTTAAVDPCSDAGIVTSARDFFIDATADPAQVEVLGLADVDGDGRDELWARTGAGASATILGLARRDGCTLERVIGQGGAPVELPVGGSVGSAAGVRCEASVDPEADLTEYELRSNDGEEYEVTATEYALDGATLVRTGTHAGAATSDDLERYTGFRCGDLRL